jgi:hypothetical protein
MTLYPSLTRLRQDGPIHSLPFDATITLGDHHLAAAGLDSQRHLATIVDVVRGTVQRMDGANWIDVEVADFPPTCAGWVTLYPRGSSAKPPDNAPWHDLCRRVEETVGAALNTIVIPRN